MKAICSIEDLNEVYFNRVKVITKNYEQDKLITFEEYLYCLKCLYEQYIEENRIMLKNYVLR